MFPVPQAAYPPGASVVRPAAMSRRPLTPVGSSRQVSTHVPHLVPHTQRVGEYGQGQEEPNGGQVAGQGLVAGVDGGGESEPASTVSLPLAPLEGSAGTGGHA